MNIDGGWRALMEDDKMQAVCDELAKGRSLRSVCDGDKTLPHWVTVLRWVQRDEDLYEMYSRARAIGAEVLADEMHDLARKPLPSDLDPRHMNAEVQRRRLEVDTLKWTFSKQQPRGVRHKKEDIDAGGQVVLVWGEAQQDMIEDDDRKMIARSDAGIAPEGAESVTGADVVKLVPDSA
jgi:hypothetical protein